MSQEKQFQFDVPLRKIKVSKNSVEDKTSPGNNS